MSGLGWGYSPDYATARARFLRVAGDRGFRLESFAVEGTGPNGEELAIDAAVLGSERPERALIISSGLHGVEGFFGSAVQIALLTTDHPRFRPPGPGEALILLHALNPYGFAWLRRADAENVDLNRNLLIDGQPYEGSPPLYAKLNALLNPELAPSRFDFFYPRSLLTILRHGMPALKAAIAGGQYDFPRGLFFGGNAPSQLQHVLASNLPRWLDSARSVIHLDFHTGLGRFGDHKLLLEPEREPAQVERLRRIFSTECIEVSSTAGIAYPTRGDLGTWCRALFPGCRYDYLCAEFGTYSPVSVLAALREENRAHHWLTPGDPEFERAKRRLKDVFVPDQSFWRSMAVAMALDLINRAHKVIFDEEISDPSTAA